MVMMTRQSRRAAETGRTHDAGLAPKRFWFPSIEHISPDEPAKMFDKMFSVLAIASAVGKVVRSPNECRTY